MIKIDIEKKMKTTDGNEILFERYSKTIRFCGIKVMNKVSDFNNEKIVKETKMGFK
jgi:hypothetical protein